MKKQLTLCMVTKEGKILLGMKKRGFGVGRWNGFGGKVEPSESIEDAAKRELLEESGVVAEKLAEVGVLEFAFQNDPKVLEVHIFRIEQFHGELVESDEMKPEWFDFDAIPYDQMWPDDSYWLPVFLAGKKFNGKFLFDRPSTAEYSSKILSQELKEVLTI